MRKLLILPFLLIPLLLTHRKEEAEPAPPTTSITFPHPVQILMPGDLCDNMQGTLMFWVQAVIDAPYNAKTYPNEKVVETREEMRSKGCG